MDFKEQVFALTAKIPSGKVTTYKIKSLKNLLKI